MNKIYGGIAVGQFRKAILISLLRLLAGVAQFAVIMFIARAFSLSEVGQYSIFVIVLGYFSQLTGLSFYTYVMREIAGHSRDGWPGLLIQQWWFLGVSLVITVLLAAMIFEADWLTIHHASYFFILLPLTVINSQHENFFVGTGSPVHGAVSLLLRSGWILPLAVVYYSSPEQIDVSVVYLAWATSEAIALAFGLLTLFRQDLWPSFTPMRWGWISEGVRVGARYTVLGLVLLLTVSVQRILLAETHGDEVVGVFHFFYVVSVFLPNLLEATIFAIILPKLIAQHRALGGGNLGPPRLGVFGALVGFGAAGLGAVWVVLPLVASLLGKPELIQNRQIFLYTAVYALLYTVSRAFHYQLYASCRDMLLVKVSVVSCAAACLSSIVLIPRHGLEGAAMSLLVAGLIMFLVYGLPFFRFKHE